MDEKINQIIQELVNLDPEFAKHKSELTSLLATLLAVKPTPVVDAGFAEKLKSQILSSAQTESYHNQSFSEKLISFSEIFMKKTVFSAAAVAVVLIVAIIGLQMYSNLNSAKNTNILSLGSDVRISHTNDGAFDNLATLALATGGRGGGGNTTATTAPNAMPTASDSSIAYGMGGGVGIPEKIGIYEPTNYKYVYKGEEISLDQAKLDVLKKVNPAISDVGALDIFGLGLVNLNSFDNSKIQSISFNQDNGYNVYVDVNTGTVAISGWYGVMPADLVACPESGCATPEPLKTSDMPNDQTLISIANEFLAAHSISVESYGAPEVMQDPYVLYARDAFVPDTVNVVYPLKVEGQDVFDESGNKTGIMVGINIRANKVVSATNISVNNFQASSYEAETDASRIIKLAETGGMYGYNYVDPQAKKTVEIELGTPVLNYVQMWDYSNNNSHQILVPSLVFPVTKQPTDGTFYRKAVVIPLIKDILNRNANDGGPVRIMNDTVPPMPAAKPESEAK